MKIAFYLPNKNCHADCSQIEKGNPGIGGTEYEIIAISYFLSVDQKKKHEILVLAENTKTLPKEINTQYVSNCEEAYKTAVHNNVELLIFQNSPLTNNIVRLADNHKNPIKLIVWAHSFISRKQLNLYARSKYVKHIICVGNEERMLFLDHRAYRKSTVIFNGFSKNINNALYVPFEKRKKEVAFLASIVPHTNFHILAKAWKSVIEKIPDAHLHVIGSGNLYNNTTKLGKWGIAEESYEKTFMSYLIDETGKILPSVTFHGKMGNEKYEILGKIKVGIPNPGGYETFCISALEMQLYGALVTTINKGGFIDTVYCQAHLYSKTEQLADYIIMLLERTRNNYSQFLDFFEKKFSFDQVCQNWNELFDNIEFNQPIIYKYRPINPDIWYKFSKYNKKIKDIIPFGYTLLPSTLFIKTIINKFRNLI